MLSLCRQTDGQTTDRRTTVKQYAPDLSMRGHKNFAWTKLKAFVVVKSNNIQTIKCVFQRAQNIV